MCSPEDRGQQSQDVWTQKTSKRDLRPSLCVHIIPTIQYHSDGKLLGLSVSKMQKICSLTLLVYHTPLNKRETILYLSFFPSLHCHIQDILNSGTRQLWQQCRGRGPGNTITTREVHLISFPRGVIAKVVQHFLGSAECCFTSGNALFLLRSPCGLSEAVQGLHS